MIRKRSLIIPGVDKELLVRDAAKAMPDLTRRRFIAWMPPCCGCETWAACADQGKILRR